MSSVLTIAGSTVNRSNTRAVLNRLVLSLDHPDSLEFGQVGQALPGSWHDGQAVTLTVDGTLRFTGQIVRRIPRPGPSGWTIGYHALGLKWAANRIPVTNPNDGTGTITFNLPSDDPSYISSFSGQSVGSILAYMFTQHASALTAAGITSYTAGDLTPLTIVPPEPTYFQGSRLWNAIEDFLVQWYPQYAAWIDAGGAIHVKDSSAFSATTITLDDDANPWMLEEITEDTSESATRVVLRGAADVEPAQVSLGEATLSEAFTSGDKAAWTWYSFTQPTGAIDDGNITSLTSTVVTVQSSNASLTWATNFWSGIAAWIQVVNPTSTSIAFSEWRLVTACSSMTAGGTATITLDRPLNNSGYTKYHLVGQPTTGGSNTWRLYNVVPAYVAQHLVKKFPRSVPWRSTDSVIQTNYPAADVCYNATGLPPYNDFPATFEVLPASGQIRFSQPVVRIFGSLANLELGGSHTDGIPNDILALLAYSRGPLTAVYPPDSGGPVYGGTAYSVNGIQRTLYRDYPQWLYSGDQTAYNTLAQQIHNTVKDTVVEGTLRYEGKYSTALTLGMAVDIAGNGYTTGYESIAAAVRTVTLEYLQGEAGAAWATSLEFSTRRRPYSGDKLYTHPMFGGGGQFMWDAAFSVNSSSAAASLGGAMADNPGAQLRETLGAEGITPEIMSHSGSMTDLGVPQTPAGYGGGGDLGIPSSMQDLGIPSSMQDLGIPSSMQDLGIDPTGGFTPQRSNLAGTGLTSDLLAKADKPAMVHAETANEATNRKIEQGYAPDRDPKAEAQAAQAKRERTEQLQRDRTDQRRQDRERKRQEEGGY